MHVGIGGSGMLHLTGGGLDEPIPLPNFTKELMSLTGQTGDMSGLMHQCRGDEPIPLSSCTKEIMGLTGINKMAKTLQAVAGAGAAMGMYLAVGEHHCSTA